MTAVFVKAIRDLRRRRLQAAVIFLTTLLAVTTGAMTLTLLAQSQDPYRTAFDAQKGAHLQVKFDPRVDPGMIAGTPSLIGASASGGPYPATDLEFRAGGHKYVVTTIGRDNPGGDVGQLRLTAGRWPAGSNEIALNRSFTDLNHISLGDRLKVVSVPQQPVLTVTAIVADIDETRADVGGQQRTWVVRTAIAPLTTTSTASYLMDYRFAGDPTTAQLQKDMDTLRGALPPGSVSDSVNYIFIGKIFHVSTQVLTSVLVAFSLFALVATAAIVANLVTGIVISAYREIGIMKAVGFTPLQVMAVFVVQILVPAAAACVVGIPVGTILGQPLVASSSAALGLAYQASFSPALDLLALGGALLVVAIAALIPATRAGLLKPAVVIANATAPRGHSGRWLRRLATQARLPRLMVLGLGDAAARPVRALLTLVAVFLGVATIYVALGETGSFYGIYKYEGHIGKVDVAITKSAALADADATKLISSQPETARVVAQTQTSITVPGIADPALSVVFRGDSGSLGYLVTSGRWINGPGEVVAPAGLLRDAHLQLGDTFTGTFRGTGLKLRVVGVLYDFVSGPGGHELILDWSTLTSAAPDLSPSSYFVALKPGSSVDAYVKRLSAAQPDLLDVRANGTGDTAFLATIAGVLFAIAAVIALIAVAGIFNTLMLNARERVRDTATLKALGMSPRQVMAMVATSAGFLALVGAVIAVPAGIWLSRALFDLIISSIGGTITPSSAYGVLEPWQLVVIPLGGVVLAVVAAMVPGRWAARTNVVEVLHAE